jgi:uncharacterized protein (DUF111 family)
MLVTLREDLHRRDVVLLVAKSIGQVRDVVSTADLPRDVPERYNTIDEAVAAAEQEIHGPTRATS